MTDLLTRLAAARPTETELDALWSPADRAATLDRVLVHRRRLPIRRTALLVAAAATAAVFVVPPVLDGGDATAADLRALAQSAVRYDGPVLSQGTWLHERSTTRQVNVPPHERGATYDHEVESWTRWEGQTMVIDHQPVKGWTEWDVIDDVADGVSDPDHPSYQDPTPAFSATLPADADGLLSYLDARVFGSSSHAEAMYSALVQLAGSHTLPPRTLGATFEALSRINHVSTSDTMVGDRPAVEISYDEQLTSSVDTVTFDRATGQLLGRSNVSDRGTYDYSVTLAEVVDEVPADIQATFDSYVDQHHLACDADRPDCVLPG